MIMKERFLSEQRGRCFVKKKKKRKKKEKTCSPSRVCPEPCVEVLVLSV